MVAIPQNIEELFSAIQRRDHAQLGAWLDMFSSPEERYAALRALAETLEGQPTGPARDLARWASNLLHQSLGSLGDEAKSIASSPVLRFAAPNRTVELKHT